MMKKEDLIRDACNDGLKIQNRERGEMGWVPGACPLDTKTYEYRIDPEDYEAASKYLSEFVEPWQVMLAHEVFGVLVEYRRKTFDEWVTETPLWNFDACEYRLKLPLPAPEPKTDWSKVEIDTPVEWLTAVSAADNRRHFAGYAGAKIALFSNGRTSVTQAGKVYVEPSEVRLICTSDDS